MAKNLASHRASRFLLSFITRNVLRIPLIILLLAGAAFSIDNIDSALQSHRHTSHWLTTLTAPPDSFLPEGFAHTSPHEPPPTTVPFDKFADTMRTFHFLRYTDYIYGLTHGALCATSLIGLVVLCSHLRRPSSL